MHFKGGKMVARKEEIKLVKYGMAEKENTESSKRTGKIKRSLLEIKL